MNVCFTQSVQSSILVKSPTDIEKSISVAALGLIAKVTILHHLLEQNILLAVWQCCVTQFVMNTFPVVYLRMLCRSCVYTSSDSDGDDRDYDCNAKSRKSPLYLLSRTGYSSKKSLYHYPKP